MPAPSSRKEFCRTIKITNYRTLNSLILNLIIIKKVNVKSVCLFNHKDEYSNNGIYDFRSFDLNLVKEFFIKNEAKEKVYYYYFIIASIERNAFSILKNIESLDLQKSELNFIDSNALQNLSNTSNLPCPCFIFHSVQQIWTATSRLPWRHCFVFALTSQSTECSIPTWVIYGTVRY